jgi:hypothetical protein
MILMWRMQTYKGTFCRTCGTAMFRDRMNRTLITGWWGLIAFFANFVFVIGNLKAFREVSKLAPPSPTSFSAGRRPLAVGAPLWQRAGLWIGCAVVPFALLVVIPAYLGGF